MVAVSTERGSPRKVSLRQYLTFDSCFERGIDTRLWPEAAYPWIEDDERIGQQTVINEEQQFYVTKRDLISHLDYRPWFVNDKGHLVLRCIPTPTRYHNLACGVLDSYTIISVDAKRRRITVTGNPWQDPITGERYCGINRYLRSQLHKTGYGFLCIGDSNKRLMYLRIEEQGADPLVSEGIPTTHCFELIDDIPTPRCIKPGITKLTLLRHLPYLSGSLTTRGAFSQVYGSLHVRMRVPKGRRTLAGVLTLPSYSKNHAHNLALADKSIGVNVLEQPGHGTVQYHSLYTPSEIEQEMCEAVLPNSFVRPSPQDTHTTHYATDVSQSHSSYVDARFNWVDVLWDWYPNNTCAWFVKHGDQYLETARASMPLSERENGPIPRMIVLKNAFDSWFNRQCEQADIIKGNPIDLATPPPWDFEIAFVRAYQWEGHPPLMGKLPAGSEQMQAMSSVLNKDNKPVRLSATA